MGLADTLHGEETCVLGDIEGVFAQLEAPTPDEIKHLMLFGAYRKNERERAYAREGSRLFHMWQEAVSHEP